jgi:23S rRNA pseudouridine1911/1915/1917 synthase
VRSAVVPKGLEGPLDRAVRSLFPSPGEPPERPTSWGAARAWIAQGKIRVGGQLVTEATARVRVGMEVSLDERARRPRDAELSDRDVVHVDPHVIVVAKPPGISTVPYDESETGPTLDVLVRDWIGRRGRGAARTHVRPNLGIVHRLDKDTSGLLVFTRTWLAKQSLAGQFRRHTVHRRYLAIAHGRVTAGTIRTFLAEDRGDGLRGSARAQGRGRLGSGAAPQRAPPGTREAVTHIEPVESLDGATLVACRLETGRTHQIRIHLSESGHPVLGERVYARRFTGPLLDAPRLMLHAAELGFVHPATEREMRWELPLPADMAAVAARLRP